MKFKLLLLFILSGCLLEVAMPDAIAEETRKTVYVWDFSMRDRTHTATTDNLTREFEAALVNAQKYSVLERRGVDNLVKQAGQELGIVDSTEIPSKPKSTLQLQGADMVIFGEIFDELGSGFSVTVTFEDWKGEKRLIKEVNIPRDKIANKPDREAAMEQLVKKIIGGTRPVLKAESHSFLIEITKCQGQGENVTVDMVVTDTDDVDRNFSLKIIVYGDPSLIYDDNGNKSVAKFARVANQEGNRLTVGSKLVSGIPTKCSLEFGSVSAHANTVSRLIVSAIGGGQAFNLTFNNIPIER